MFVRFYSGRIGLIRVTNAATTVERIVSKQFLITILPSLHLLLFIGSKMFDPVRNLQVVLVDGILVQSIGSAYHQFSLILKSLGEHHLVARALQSSKFFCLFLPNILIMVVRTVSGIIGREFGDKLQAICFILVVVILFLRHRNKQIITQCLPVRYQITLNIISRIGEIGREGTPHGEDLFYT